MHLFLTFGDADRKDFCHALKDIRYSGVLCLEASPPSSIPDKLFCDYSVLLCKTTREIINNAK